MLGSMTDSLPAERKTRRKRAHHSEDLSAVTWPIIRPSLLHRPRNAGIPRDLGWHFSWNGFLLFRCRSRIPTCLIDGPQLRENEMVERGIAADQLLTAPQDAPWPLRNLRSVVASPEGQRGLPTGPLPRLRMCLWNRAGNQLSFS